MRSLFILSVFLTNDKLPAIDMRCSNKELQYVFTYSFVGYLRKSHVITCSASETNRYYYRCASLLCLVAIATVCSHHLTNIPVEQSLHSVATSGT